MGEQFEYKLRQPVTILRNESALLPILQSDMAGEKVAMFKSADNESHPRLAFWLKNSSGLSLDAGAVTVIDSNAFAGEGLIESVQPGESRLLSYAIRSRNRSFHNRRNGAATRRARDSQSRNLAPDIENRGKNDLPDSK